MKNLRKKQAGFTMIEVLLALSIGSLILASGSRFMQDRVDDIRDQNTAQYQKRVAVAAERFINDHYATIASALAINGVALPYAIPDIRAAGYLPDGLTNRNPYDQTPCVLVRRLTNHANGDPRLEALVTTEGGNPIAEKRVPFIAAQGGAYGGFVPAAAPTTAQGAFGVWAQSLVPYTGPGVSCSGTPVSTNRLAFVLFFDGAQIGGNTSDLLHRNAVAGRPDLNTMNTHLNMGGFNLQNVNTVTAQTVNTLGNVTANNVVAANNVSATTITATGTGVLGKLQINDVVTENTPCAAPGLTARDSAGSILSCQSGLWATQGGAASPARMIGYFHMSTCPAGWIAANGASGTPDLRGYFVRGMDLGTCRGDVCNRTSGSFQADEIQTHGHRINGASGTDQYAHGLRTSGSRGVAGSWASTFGSLGYVYNDGGGNRVIENTGGNETRPNNVALLACMKQ